MRGRLLYLPIETKAREMLGKLLLAAKAVEKGWVVVFGDMLQVEQAALRFAPGVFMEISIPEKKSKDIAAYKARGHIVVNLCEENIVYIDGKDYCDRKVGPTSLQSTDILLTCGVNNEKDLLTFRPESRDKIRLVGNPRFDTLRDAIRNVYDDDAQRIKQQYGKFLIVNTNFAYVNNYYKPGRNYVSMLKRRGMIVDAEQEALKEREVERKRRQLASFKSVLTKLAREHLFDRIVVRPHPSENHEFWKWAEALGIDIRYQGNANIWMLAADAIFHTGCTTGIEGLLLDKPVATYLPDPGNEFENQADEMSRQIADAREFLDYVKEIRELPPDDVRERLHEQRKVAARYICNVEGDLSINRILGVLNEFDLPELETGNRDFGTADVLRENVKNAVLQTRDGARRLIGHKTAATVRKQKFPGLEKREIEYFLGVWRDSDVIQSFPVIQKLRNSLFLMKDSRAG